MTLQFSKALTESIKDAFRRGGVDSQDVMAKLSITKLEADRLLGLERWDTRTCLQLAFAFDLEFAIYAHEAGTSVPTPQQVLKSLESMQWDLVDGDQG